MVSVKIHLKFILTFRVTASFMCSNYFISSYRRNRIFIPYFSLVFTYKICILNMKVKVLGYFLGYWLHVAMIIYT